MSGPGTSLTRWLLLCALAFGVVGTHHLGLGGHHAHGGLDGPLAVAVAHVAVDPPASHPAAPDGHSAETLLHLCLVALAGVVVLGALLLRRQRVLRGPAPPQGRHGARRSPPHAALPSPVVLRL